MRRKDDFSVKYGWMFYSVFLIDLLVLIYDILAKKYVGAVILAAAIGFLVLAQINLVRSEKRRNEARLRAAHTYVGTFCGQCEHTPVVEPGKFPICPATGEEITGDMCSRFKF